MNIALASCENLPGWEVDDQPLIDSLESKGATVHRPAWTEDVDWNQFDISVIRTTWDYHLQKDAFLKWCKSVPRLYNNAKIVEWNSHKSYLNELEQNGISIAPTIWISVNERVELMEAMKKLNVLHGRGRGFIKPQVGACASDTLRFDMDELEVAQAFLESNSHQEMMVQPYLERVETEGELTAIFIDGKFSHGVQKIPVRGDYRVQDDFGASDMPYTFTPDEIELMTRTLQFVPMNEDLLYARFDYLRDDGGKLVLNELELVEPSLFFRHSKNSALLFAEAIINRVMIRK